MPGSHVETCCCLKRAAEQWLSACTAGDWILAPPPEPSGLTLCASISFNLSGSGSHLRAVSQASVSEHLKVRPWGSTFGSSKFMGQWEGEEGQRARCLPEEGICARLERWVKSDICKTQILTKNSLIAHCTGDNLC